MKELNVKIGEIDVGELAEKERRLGAVKEELLQKEQDLLEVESQVELQAATLKQCEQVIRQGEEEGAKIQG